MVMDNDTDGEIDDNRGLEVEEGSLNSLIKKTHQKLNLLFYPCWMKSFTVLFFKIIHLLHHFFLQYLFLLGTC